MENFLIFDSEHVISNELYLICSFCRFMDP